MCICYNAAMDAVLQLAELLDTARTAVAFTGAGISTESGIPDFRSPGGVWSRQQPVMYDDFINSRSERVRYWKMRVELYRDFLSAKPNAGHYALARLEQHGRLAGVVTQNIDGLHQEAGSKQVVELHGTNRKVACVDCLQEWEPQEILSRIEAGDEAPECASCGGLIKAKTVLFGQAMPEGPMMHAAQLGRAADLYLAIGSSLVVEPAASFPRQARYYGATLVIINKTPTPLDDIAQLVIRDPIGSTLERAIGHLNLD